MHKERLKFALDVVEDEHPHGEGLDGGQVRGRRDAAVDVGTSEEGREVD